MEIHLLSQIDQSVIDRLVATHLENAVAKAFAKSEWVGGKNGEGYDLIRSLVKERVASLDVAEAADAEIQRQLADLMKDKVTELLARRLSAELRMRLPAKPAKQETDEDT